MSVGVLYGLAATEPVPPAPIPEEVKPAPAPPTPVDYGAPGPPDPGRLANGFVELPLKRGFDGAFFSASGFLVSTGGDGSREIAEDFGKGSYDLGSGSVLLGYWAAIGSLG